MNRMAIFPRRARRAFDARAMGTMFGSGVGVVVLKLIAERARRRRSRARV